MANVRAFRSGNWSDTNTTTSPWATGGVLYAPDSSDDVFTNGFTITVDTSPTVLSITNTSATSRTWKDGATTTAAAGGGCALANGVTLTSTTASLTTVQGNFLTLSGTNSASFVGNIKSNPVSAYSVVNNGSGTLNFTGFTEATISSTGGTFRNQVGGSLIINGGVINNANSFAIFQDAGGNTTINGYATANGSMAVNNAGVGQVTIVGTMTASNGGGNVIRSLNTSSLVRASGSFICAADGTMAVAAIKMILNTTPSNAKTRYALDGTGAYVDMFTADNSLGQASPSDVRDGVSYASGALVGSLKVPAAASVAYGVPVDATTGTAVLTPAAVWEYATREITGGTVTNLTNAPASVTPTDIWSHSSRTLTSASGPSAADIRTELDTNSTKLANLDATVSSRLASASYTAPANSDITAIKAKTDALPSDPADQSLLEAAIAAVTAPSATDVATAVRSELTTELAHLDADISTRATPADIPATDISSIKSTTDALNTDRLAQVSTVATTGSQLAAALS